MNPGRPKTFQSLAVLVLIGGCASIPSIAYDSGGTDAAAAGSDTGAPPASGDATVSGVDAGDAGAAVDGWADDLGDGGGFDDGPTDQPGDDGGDAATISCGLPDGGSKMVQNCANCPSGPLRCYKKGTVDECVDDCTASCGAGWFPCLHCPNATAAPRGTCLPVDPATGEIACTAQNLCACKTDVDCPPLPGAAQSCEQTDAAKGRCLTCGSPSSSGLACLPAVGDAGVCSIAPKTAPKCE